MANIKNEHNKLTFKKPVNDPIGAYPIGMSSKQIASQRLSLEGISTKVL